MAKKKYQGEIVEGSLTVLEGVSLFNASADVEGLSLAMTPEVDHEPSDTEPPADDEEPFVSAEDAVEKAMEPSDDPPQSPSAEADGAKEMRQWAQLKGHIHELPKAVRFPGEAVNGNPHLAVILVHSRLASNSVVSEDEYDRLAAEAYDLVIG